MTMWRTFRRFKTLSNGMSIIPKRKRLSFEKLKRTPQKYRNIGNDEININENSMIFNKVRAYIRQTKRF